MYWKQPISTEILHATSLEQSIWLHIILRCRNKDGPVPPFMHGNNRICTTLKRGQMIFNVRAFAKEHNVHRNTVTKRLYALCQCTTECTTVCTTECTTVSSKVYHGICIKKKPYGLIITVLNYNQITSMNKEIIQKNSDECTTECTTVCTTECTSNNKSDPRVNTEEDKEKKKNKEKKEKKPETPEEIFGEDNDDEKSSPVNPEHLDIDIELRDKFLEYTVYNNPRYAIFASIAEVELDAFLDYWLQVKKSKPLWKTMKAFDCARRFYTWLRNAKRKIPVGTETLVLYDSFKNKEVSEMSLMEKTVYFWNTRIYPDHPLVGYTSGMKHSVNKMYADLGGTGMKVVLQNIQATVENNEFYQENRMNFATVIGSQAAYQKFL